MALRHCSRSGVFGNRAEFSRINIIGVQKSGGPEKFWRRSQPRLWRRVIARDRAPWSIEQKISRADVIAVQYFAVLRKFASDLTSAHGAPFLLEIGSLRQVSRILKDRRSRGPKSGGPENFWRRSQPRLWRRVIARDREPSAIEQKNSRVAAIAAQNFARLDFFDSDLNRAHGAPFLREIGSLRQVSRVSKDRHSRGTKIWRA